MAGKILEKKGSMKNIFLIWILAFSLIGVASSEPADSRPDDLKMNISLLASRCGYALDSNILNSISKSSVNLSDRIILFDFFISMKPADRKIQGKLSFGCFMAESTASKQGVGQRTTAADEIAQADSGGRYARHIVWQRRYEGKGWSGTIAYVNSVFGDQERLTIPDYFLICPEKGDLPCFSFEVLRGKLKKNESDRIPTFLGGIETAR